MRVNASNKNRFCDFLNLLEPAGLVRAFLREPPENFEPVVLNVNEANIPGFLTGLNLLTTADEKIKRLEYGIKRLLPGSPGITLKARTIFIGTTVSEYCLFQRGVDLEDFVECAVSKFEEHRCRFLVVKDIPLNSPLLSAGENAFSERLISFLAGNGFTIIGGQALGFVPVNFSSTNEYLTRFSRSRRKDLKRKLRSPMYP